MSELALTAAFGDYDRITALRTAQVRAQGIDLRVLCLPPGEIFSRMCEGLEFASQAVTLHHPPARKSVTAPRDSSPRRQILHAQLFGVADLKN